MLKAEAELEAEHLNSTLHVTCDRLLGEIQSSAGFRSMSAEVTEDTVNIIAILSVRVKQFIDIELTSRSRGHVCLITRHIKTGLLSHCRPERTTLEGKDSEIICLAEIHYAF